MMKRLPLMLAVSLCLMAKAQTTYPPGIYGDTLHAPFFHGVASGDPLPDAVILWTRLSPDVGTPDPTAVDWEISGTPDFATVVNSGTASTGSAADWTVKVDATGLLPHSTYYYRFSYGGSPSMTGRTRTSPDGAVDHLRMAAGSCSSVWSGHYNAFARVAERNDLDLFLHVGDYIYDYADADEQVRMPAPDFPDPSTLQQWRDLHAYNCLDADLRAAKASLPFVVIWDNHDVDSDDSTALRGAIKAFLEWTPTRLPDPADSLRLYRSLHYGNLLDLTLMDVLLFRDTDTLPDGQPVFIGNEQMQWVQDELASGPAQWHVLGSQNMMGHFLLTGLPGWIPFGDGEVMDSSAWDGYGSERLRLLEFMDSAAIPNVVVVSGDAHISTVMDLDTDPTDGASYDGATGAGSVAVEFLPASITRGNLDEMGLGFAESILIGVTDLANPHHLHKEFTSHGYGILDIRPDSIVAEFWYSGILAPSATESFAGGWVVRSGDNHWQRTPTTTPTDTSTVHLQEAQGRTPMLSLFPNPAHQMIHLQYSGLSSGNATLLLSDAQGRSLLSQSVEVMPSGTLALPLKSLPVGLYWLTLQQGRHSSTLPFRIE